MYAHNHVDVPRNPSFPYTDAPSIDAQKNTLGTNLFPGLIQSAAHSLQRPNNLNHDI